LIDGGEKNMGKSVQLAVSSLQNGGHMTFREGGQTNTQNLGLNGESWKGPNSFYPSSNRKINFGTSGKVSVKEGVKKIRVSASRGLAYRGV